MGLRKKVQTARKIIASLGGQEHARLEEICEDIRGAENILLTNGIAVLRTCWDRCDGICYRNIYTDDIISLIDLIFIFAIDPAIASSVEECVKTESIYSADCNFLKNGEGPCLLPTDARPKECFLNFCGDASSIKKEIRLVRSQFGKLQRFILFRQARALFKKLTGRAEGRLWDGKADSRTR